MRLLRHDLYIEPIQAYIDPPFPVDRALVTHGHSDHARGGHKHVMATADTIGIMKQRYGENCAETFQAVAYGETVTVDDTQITFYPAGHILGSAQILLERQGQRIVVSGDYKRSGDGTCPPFEPVACDIFVTEATFGLPIFQHPQPQSEIDKLLHSMKSFPDHAHVIGAYPLGKTQRLVSLLRMAGYDLPIYMHGSLLGCSSYYQNHGVDLGDVRKATGLPKETFRGQIVVAPPSALQEPWSRRLGDAILGMASGWMMVKQRVRQRGIELPLVISDHADWQELQQTIRDVGASEIWVTHGREDALVYWCESQGLKAAPLHLQGREEEEGEE